MPIGLFDIRDRAVVFHPNEIAAGQKQCEATGIAYIDQPGAPAIRVCDYVAMLTKRFERAMRTGQVMDAMRAGYCTIQPNGAPPASRATH